MAKKGKCCLCGGVYHHYGNNPAPLMEDTDENPNRCCDVCNELVILERLRLDREQND